MGRLKACACAVSLLVLSALVFNRYVYYLPHDWDETLHVKSALAFRFERRWTEADRLSPEYAFVVDHPSLKDVFYAARLRAAGVTSLDIPDVDYSRGPAWNVGHGRLPDMERVVMPLRQVNVAFMCGAALLVYLAALIAVRAPVLALLAPLPLVLNGRIGRSVVAYIGCDAVVAFFLALSLVALVAVAHYRRHDRYWAALLLGVCGGLATSAKINGALAVIAACGYLALQNRGARRVLLPAAVVASSVAVFLLLNPVFRSGGPGWTATVVRDVLACRALCWEQHRLAHGVSRLAIVGKFLPFAPLLYVIPAGLLAFGRRPAVAAASLWAGVMALGTVSSVSCTFLRYQLPIEIGAYAAMGILAGLFLEPYVSGAAASAVAAARRALPFAAVAVFAGAVLLAAVCALEVMGPTRLGYDVPAATRLRLLALQAGPSLGRARPLDREAVLAVIGEPRPGEPLPGIPEPVLDQRDLSRFALAALVAALGPLWLLARRVLGSSGLALAALAPLVLTEVLLGAPLARRPSEGLLMLFAASALYFLASMAAGERRRVSTAVALSACLAAAVAASPGGIAVACAALALLARPFNARGFLRAGAVLAVIILLFQPLERVLLMVGARGTYDFLYALLNGIYGSSGRAPAMEPVLSALVRNGFDWPALLPLAVAALIALRRPREPWIPVLGVWIGVIIGLAAFLQPDTSPTMSTLPDLSRAISVEANLAVSFACGLAGLQLLRRPVPREGVDAQ